MAVLGLIDRGNVVAENRVHGSLTRGLDMTPVSVLFAGRFGRMFRNLPVRAHDDSQLEAIAALMLAAADPVDTKPVPVPEPTDDDANPNLPAGYTYLGQFIDHDITFDPVSSLQRLNDPDALHDFRTPRFDLDNLYGRGPDDQPYLYRNGHAPDLHPQLGFDQRGIMFKLGRLVADASDPTQAVVSGPDLPRDSDNRAIIADPRNDENLVVSQLQSLMLRFHNRVVENTFASTGLTGVDLFEEAQRRVRWHYQWIVVHDFLRRIVDGDPGDLSTSGPLSVVDDILTTKPFVAGGAPWSRKVPLLAFYKFKESPYMPVEFSVAAYRFGHSMVRPSYFINDVVRAAMGNARVPVFSLDENPLANLNGFRALPEQWGIDWKFFFDIDPAVPAQRSYKIDATLSNPLGNLPAAKDMPSLALRNLRRGHSMSLPSGQTVARAMGIAPMSDEQLGLQDAAPDYMADAPLWFYILKEAEVLQSSTHLGPVGGRIVAEVLIGLLAGDPLSFLSVEPNWAPELTGSQHFTMADLIRFTLQGPGESPTGETPQPAGW